MRKLIPMLALLLLVTTCVSHADAGCAVVRQRVLAVNHGYSHSYAAQAAVYQPLAYGYTGYYNHNYDPQQQLIKDQAAFIKLQTQAYQELRLNLSQNLRGGETRPEAQVESFEAFASKRCMACHQDGTAKVEESGFVMFEKDGKLSRFSLAEKNRMSDLIQKGEMPPGNQLPQSERAAAKQFLTKK